VKIVVKQIADRLRFGMRWEKSSWILGRRNILCSNLVANKHVLYFRISEKASVTLAHKIGLS
jgi:hypothetical protein